MKKHLSLALFAGLFLSTLSPMLHADATATPTAVPTFKDEMGTPGGNVMMKDRKVLSLGRYPGAVSSFVMPFRTVVNMGAGWPVVFAAITYSVAVSATATVGDKTVIGLATFPAGVSTVAAASTVFVTTRGMAIGHIAVNVTVGDMLIPAGTAGFLTKSTAATEGIFTQVSHTAIVGRAAETVNVTAGDGYCKVLVGL